MLSWLTYGNVVRDIQAQQRQRAVTVAQLLKNTMEAELYNAKRVIESTALRIEGPEDWRPVMQTFILRHPNVEVLALFDPRGRELLRIDRDLLVSESPDMPEDVPQLAVDLAKSGDPKVIRLFRVDETGEPMMLVATPFMDPTRVRLEYLLVSQHHLRPLSTILSEVPAVPDTVLYLLGPGQQVIAHQNPSVALRGTVFSGSIAGIDGNSGLRPGLSDDLAFISVEPIAFGRFRLQLVAEHQLWGAIAKRMQSFLGVVVLLVFSLATPLLLRQIISNRVVTRVERLSSAAHSLAGGDFSTRIKMQSNDEIGKLAQSFNELAAKIDFKLSARSRTEESLRENERLLEDGIQALPLGFAYYGADDVLVRCNERYPALLTTSRHLIAPGVTFEALIRNSAALVAPKMGYDNEADYLADRLSELRGPGRIWTYKQSTGRWVTMTEHPATGGGFISIVEDISDKRESEERLRHAQRMEAIGQLTGGIAHDFNNLLAVIMGNAEFLQDVPNQDQKLVGEILKATNRGASLTQRLLAYARKQSLTPKLFKLDALVSEMEGLLARTLGETVAISVLVQDGLWVCRADPSQVEDALLNPAINARDAMPDGGKLTIECANVGLDSDYAAKNPEASVGEYVMLAVSDNGTGMTEEVKAKAFEPFYTTKEIGQGSGLGLSMIYGFAKQTGGHVSIYSEQGKGTTVKLYLPRGDNSGRIVAVQPGAPIQKGHGETVLVIEDDPVVRLLAERIISELGYVAVTAEHAAAARTLLVGGQHFDVILSDVILPGGTSGPDFAEEVRAEKPDARIIFMSGYPAEAARRNGFIGSDSVLLNKPFRREALARALREALEPTL